MAAVVVVLLLSCEGSVAPPADHDGGSRDGGRSTADAGPATGLDGGTTDAGGGGPISLALWNVTRDEALAHLSPIPAVVHRVELPPIVTIAAASTTPIAAVRFFVDGTEARLDDAAPFRLTEMDGEPTGWNLTYGAHTIEARGYTDATGAGEPAGVASATFDYSDLGLDPDFEPLSSSENDAWVSANLDASMEARTFTGSMGTLPYRLFVPPAYDDGVRYPLFIYLHGRGTRGDDNRAALYRGTQLFTGPRSIVSPNFRNVYPAIIVVPQCSDTPEHHEWAHWIGNSESMPFAGLGSDGSYMQHPDPWSSALHVRELVDAIAAELSIDAERVYLTGESMGGFGTWEFTTRWPDIWAVGVPMAGFSDRTKVDLVVEIPFWVFHGDADTSNPVAGSRAMVMALETAGAEVRYTEYAGASHGDTFYRAWRDEPELLPWMFSQRR